MRLALENWGSFGLVHASRLLVYVFVGIFHRVSWRRGTKLCGSNEATSLVRAWHKSLCAGFGATLIKETVFSDDIKNRAIDVGNFPTYTKTADCLRLAILVDQVSGGNNCNTCGRSADSQKQLRQRLDALSSLRNPVVCSN